MSRKYIIIEDLKLFNQRELRFRLLYSKSMEKYFLTNTLYVKYDKEVGDVDESILMVPCIANVILIAWATGADVYVEKLDKTYLESLSKIRSVLKKWYPKLPFSTKIDVEKVISNKFRGKNYGLLFSGGVDSACSYIRHRDKNPCLIMVRGADMHLDDDIWFKIKKTYEDFAAEEGVEITFIECNTSELKNINLLQVEFGRFLTDFSWWGGIEHGIVFLGLCAPITVKKKIGTLFIASSFTKDFNYPWGSHPLIDNKVSWADVRVIHDGYHLDRQEKIKVIKNYWLRKRKQYPLRVCWENAAQFNCGKCEKCWRTMIGLIIEGIDPKILGFHVEDNFLESVKSALQKRQLHLCNSVVYFWQTLQNHINNNALTHNLYNSKEFFEWFKTFKIRANVERGIIMPHLWIIYYRLPKSIQHLLSKFNKIRQLLR